MTVCLIEAGLWLLGPEARELRFDAAIRVDGGMVAQIGALEAVAYGNDALPRYGARSAFAVPILAGEAPPTLAERFGGADGRLTPGSPANLALFQPGLIPNRSDLAAAVGGEPSGVSDLFVGGRPLIENGAPVAAQDGVRAALRALLACPANAREEAIWAAARQAVGVDRRQ